MKKSIFLSVLALAAVVSCQKSEIVDSKYGNDAIGFETYLGRSAQTKAGVTTNDNFTKFGVYGFYTIDDYVVGDKANLMQNVEVSGAIGSGWTYRPTKYWTNASDKYTFLAYSPYSHSTITLPALETSTVITYKVPGTLDAQQDLLYSNNNVDVTKEAKTATVDGNKVTKVPFTFNHALARLTVKANAKMYDKTSGAEVTGTPASGQEYDFTFTITDIKIKGKFNTELGFDLYAGSWAESNPNVEVEYDLYTPATGVTGQTLNQNLYDFSGTVVTTSGETTTTIYGTNYLMMIPSSFSTTNKAILTVTYNVNYAGAVSENEANIEITTPFEQGQAYSINLTFERDATNAIVFDVTTVTPWVDASVQESNVQA